MPDMVRFGIRKLDPHFWLASPFARRGACAERRVPRFTQEAHDLAVVLLPCDVKGRPAVLGSHRRIRASLEETLGDHEAAVGCRAMKS